MLTVPDAPPKTKPRACNYGLSQAKGVFSVIYDAEDAPEPDQLKKACIAFRRDPEKRVLCVQGKLNYFNSRHNLLTRLFTVEYSTYFDLTLPGYQLFNLPLPLGGTSNHFRTDILRKIGGWDPFNVTEDCDLGLRIYEYGYKTRLINSTTYEEANSQVWNWMRQPVALGEGVHPDPSGSLPQPVPDNETARRLRCVRRIPRRRGQRDDDADQPDFLGGDAALRGAAAAWALRRRAAAGPDRRSAVRHGLRGGPDRTPDAESVAARLLRHRRRPVLVDFSQIFFAGSLIMFLANFIFIGIGVAACVKRKYYRLIPAALLMPFYWLLISLAAWKGFIQIFTKPFYWEKTKHGLTDNIEPCKEETA